MVRKLALSNALLKRSRLSFQRVTLKLAAFLLRDVAVRAHSPQTVLNLQVTARGVGRGKS